MSREELWRITRSIPKGFVATYGDVGRQLDPPISGFLAGKWMAAAPEGVPWWRVVSAKGELPVSKRDPNFAHQQRQLLESEGVAFNGDAVAMDLHRHTF